MGKSLFIQRMVEQLQMNEKITRNPCVTIPLHGPKVTPDIVLDYIEKYMQEPPCTIYHLDIAPTVCKYTTLYKVHACHIFVDVSRSSLRWIQSCLTC